MSCFYFVHGHFSLSSVLGAVLFLRAFFFFFVCRYWREVFLFFSVSSAHERSVVCALRLAGFCKRCLWRTTAVAMKFVFFLLLGGLVRVHGLTSFFFFFLFLSSGLFFLLRCLTRIKCFFFVAFVYYSQFTVSSLARERGKR